MLHVIAAVAVFELLVIGLLIGAIVAAVKLLVLGGGAATFAALAHRQLSAFLERKGLDVAQALGQQAVKGIASLVTRAAQEVESEVLPETKP